MTKLAVLFAVCLVVLFAAAIAAAPSFTMEFVGEFHTGRPAIVRVTTSEIDLAEGITVNVASQTDVDDIGKTNWSTYITHDDNSVVSDMNQDVLKQNNFISSGNPTAVVVCVDEATHRPLVQLDYNDGEIMYFSVLSSAAYSENFPVTAPGSFTFLCPITIKSDEVYAPEFTTLLVEYNDGDDMEFTLAPPTWSWTEPIISITSASYSANTGTLLGGKVEFKFSTDTAGIHHVTIRNGPQPIYYSRRNQDFTSYQCGEEVEAYIINDGGLQIHIKDAAANGETITCTIDVDGYMTDAYTERSQVVIAMDTMSVARGIDIPVLDATFTPSFISSGPISPVDGSSSTGMAFIIFAQDLMYSASPLHTNSTVEFRFTGIDVNTIAPYPTEYRSSDSFCSDIAGTFSQDDTSVFVKDISGIVNRFACIFYFLGSKIVRLDEFTPVPTVEVLIDGVMLYNRAARSTTYPLYLPIGPQMNTIQSQIFQDDSIIKHVLEFSLSDNSQAQGTVPQEPILVFSYANPATWPTASYADVLLCEATSPSSSAYEPLTMTFDLERRTWTADLSNLIDTDAYQINFRCTRSEAVVKKFDIVQNTANELKISFLDVVSGKGFNSLSSYSNKETAPKLYLTTTAPTSPAVPTAFTRYFSFESTVFIDDFANLVTLGDDVSTKVLAAIQAGYDAYDAQPSPDTPINPAKLSPTLVNKPKMAVSNSIVNTDEYSPSFGQIMYDLFYTIIGHQFQQGELEAPFVYSHYNEQDSSELIHGFSNTAHTQRSTPQVTYTQHFTSGSTYVAVKNTTATFAYDFATADMNAAFYKDAFSTPPAIPFTFNINGFDFATLTQGEIMNPITECGYYQVAYVATEDTGTTYEFSYDKMTNSGNVDNNISTRFICNYAESCSADADCASSYCSEGVCALHQPQLKFPYVQFDTVSDLSEYDAFNNSIVASLSAAVVAVIVAIVM